MPVEEISSEQQAYFKIKSRLDNLTDRDKLLSACETYFNLALGERPWTEQRSLIEPLPLPQLQQLTLELSAEAINRDMIDYVTTGFRGNLANKMYQALK